MFSISLLVKLYVGIPIARFLSKRLIGNRLRGVARGATKAIIGTTVTVPFTSAIVTLLFCDATDARDYANAYLSSLATSLPLSVFLGYFVVGPVVGLLFNNRIKPAGGLRMLKALSDHAHLLARAFGC